MSTLADWLDIPEVRREFDLFDRIGKESPRGMAVLVSAELERALLILLKNYLSPGKARTKLLGGPLSTFAARIDLAFALLLIEPDEHRGLHIIRDIRNHLAHDPAVNFSDPEIEKMIRRLPLFVKESDAQHHLQWYAANLVVRIEHHAVSAANTRVYEESFGGSVRGRISPFEPYQSREEAALAYRDPPPEQEKKKKIRPSNKPPVTAA